MRIARHLDPQRVNRGVRAAEQRLQVRTAESEVDRSLRPSDDTNPPGVRRAQRRVCAARFAPDLYGAFSVKRLFWVCCQFFVRSGKAVLRPVACEGSRDRNASGAWRLAVRLPPREKSVRNGLVWGFFCQAVVLGLLSVLCSEREGGSSSRRLAIRFAERAEGVKGPKRLA